MFSSLNEPMWPETQAGIEMDASPLKNSLLKNDPEFWPQLRSLTRLARDFEELFLLSSLRKKAHARNLLPPKPSKEKLRDPDFESLTLA